ncbi:MAG: hypothetical protein A2075_16555 [Geobacteraceae bacterium GWC2_58_44]|nr:MAG: hypothetical protein A2075_16555 [Geobacteraceae bacterium GWC2_58_44]HBG05059.1 hypothetical protein [Geobacter sp.]
MKQGILGSVVKVALLLVVLSAFGCGGDDDATPTGKVVKGPVVGATVKDKDGNAFAVTDLYGTFPLTSPGPYSTTGGRYVLLNRDGTPGASVPAPAMKAPAGVSQITPLSTLAADATPEQLDVILTVLANMGADLDTDLSVKTSTNAVAIIFSETVGAVLASTPGSASAATKAAVTEALIAAALDLSEYAGTPAESVTAITTAVSDAIAGNATLAALPSLSASLVSAASTAAEGAGNYPEMPLPVIPTTGSNGGTGEF